MLNVDFIDLRTRAELLDLCGDTDGAEALRLRSLEIAREVDLTCYAYQLLWRNKINEAVALLELNAEQHPDSWNAWDSLADAWSVKGDEARAAECYSRAARLVRDDEQRLRIEQALRDLVAAGRMAS